MFDLSIYTYFKLSAKTDLFAVFYGQYHLDVVLFLSSIQRGGCLRTTGKPYLVIIIVRMSFSGPPADMEFKREKTQAFEKIFMRYHGAIVYFARDFVKDRDAAKDLASEVFMKIWHLREDFENLKAVKAFIYVSVRNACLKHTKEHDRKGRAQDSV